METKTQDLLLCQLIQTANLCWLRKRGLTTFNIVTSTDASLGTLDINFGIPNTHADSHATLLQDWLETAKKTERMHILLLLLAEHKKHNLPEKIAESWQREGELLQKELFDLPSPGVFSTQEEAISTLKS